VTNGIDETIDKIETGVEWLPKAPSHWRIQRISTIFTESTEMGCDELPVLSVSINWGISDRELTDDDRHRIVNHIEDKSSYKRVRPGDLVYNMMRAWQGAFGVAKVDGLVSPAYVVARPKEEIHSLYFEPLLRTQACIEEFRRASKGIADFRQRLYWEHFRQIHVALPPIEEQKMIAERVSVLSDKIANAIAPIEKSIDRLREYRSALITAAVTGQIDITTWGKSGAVDRQLDAIQDEMGAA
jgi:type I restriction enzyme S subunit